MPQKKLHPDFIPDTETDDKSLKASKSSTDLHPDFIPDSNEEGGQAESSAWKSLTAGTSKWLGEHPKIREFGERLLTGTSPEHQKMLEEHGIPRVLGTPESEQSILPKIYSQPETFAGGFAKSLYEDIVRPQFTPSGFAGWGSPGPNIPGRSGRFGQVVDLGEAPSNQKLLTAGPKFQAETPGGVVTNTAAGESIPIRRSTEIPYRPTIETPSGRLEQSFSTAAGDTPRAQEAFRRFSESANAAPREPIGLLPEGVRQPQINDLLLSEEGKLPGEMSTSDALMYEPEFKPWRGLSNLSEAILGRDIMKRDIEAGLNPHRGPIDWGPASSGETDETSLISSRPMGEAKPTAKYKYTWEDEHGNPMPMYEVIGGESHGSDVTADTLRQRGIDVPETPTNTTAKVEEPSLARTESGGMRMDIGDRKDMLEIFRNTYSGSTAHVASKELLQNAIDATAHLGKDAKVDINVAPSKREITVSDNGPGLTRDEIDTVYSNLASSGKRGKGTKTIGELGVGKATYMVAGEHVSVETVARENGKLVKHEFSGTPEEVFEEVHPIKTEVPEGTPTGTKVTLKIPEGEEFTSLDNYLSNFSNYSNNPVPVNVKHEGKTTASGYQYGAYDKTIESRGKIEGKSIGQFETDASKYNLTVPKDATWSDNDSIVVILSNRGMFQGAETIYVPRSEVPDRIVVEVDSKVPANKATYPLTAPTRERLKDVERRAVTQFINKELIAKNVEKRKGEVNRIFDSIISDKSPNAYYDGGGRYTPQELENVKNSKNLNNIGEVIRSVTDELESLFPDETGKIVKTGFIFDKVRGVNLKPQGRDEFVLMANPFSEIEGNDPKRAAQGIVHLVMHEFTHKAVRSEGANFTAHLATVYEKFDLEKQLEARNKILRHLTDGQYFKSGSESGYSPEIQKLLSEYQESRGREATTNDLLLREAGSLASESKGPERVSKRGGSDGGGTPTRTPVQSALKKLANAVISSKGLREEQELLYKKEQARRFAAFGRVKTTGEAGARESLGKLKGEMPKLNIEELQLTPEERDSLFDSIKQSSISNGEKATGYQALYKLLSGGHVPQRGELHILDTVFGGGMGMEGGPGAASEYEILSNILKAAAEPAKMRPIKESSMARQIYEITRGLMSVDIPFMSSAAFRQGVGLAGTARWFQAVGEQARVFGSEKVYDKIMKDLDTNMINIRRVTWNPEKQRSELKSIADQIGLKTSDLKNIPRREEQIKSSLTERIPGLGSYIRASNRSYTTMLNSLRTHTAEDWIKAANILDKNGNITDLDKARRIGYTINELTSGSSLDIDLPFSRFTGSQKGLKLDKFSDELSTLFFSPKMLMRDARMINPLNYIKTNKLERLEYLKGAMRRAAVWAGFTGLAAIGLGAVVSSNITSSDFAKARIKDTRADAGSGLLQWMVLIARQALGKNTSSTSGRTTELGSTVVSPTRMDLLTQFVINRLHPTIGLGALALTATRTRPFYPMSSVVEHVTPMYTSDIHDLMNSDPEIRQIVLGLAAGSLSMGSITYGREDYGKPQYKIPYDPKFEGGMFGGSKRNPPIRKMNLSF